VLKYWNQNITGYGVLDTHPPLYLTRSTASAIGILKDIAYWTSIRHYPDETW
jgi:hypothetical protein